MSSFLHVSAKEHGAVVFMVELAVAFEDGAYLTIGQIAERMHLSEGYLEEIVAPLKRAGLIVGRQGPGGGYRLAKSPKEISIDAVLSAMNGPLSMVDCQGNVLCPVAEKCLSKKLWDRIKGQVEIVLKETTLDELK